MCGAKGAHVLTYHFSKGSVGVGRGCGWSARERFCSYHSLQLKLSAGWPYPASTYWHKSFISLISAVNLAWLLGKSPSVLFLPLVHPKQQWHPSHWCYHCCCLSCGFWIFHMETVSCYGVSCTSMVGSNSVCLVCSAIGLISISNLSKYSLEW